MANIRISQLPTPPTALTGLELVPVVQNGQTVQTTTSAIAGVIASTSGYTNLTTVNLAVSSLNGYLYANGASNVTSSTTIPVTALSGTVPVSSGGTGATTFTAGLLYGSGTTALTTASPAQIVTAIGTTAVTNATNAVTATNAGNVTATSNSTLVTLSALSLPGSQVSGAVSTATTATNVAGGAAGSIVYQTAAATTTMLSLGTSGYVLTAGASAPAYVSQSSLSVGSSTTATTATNVTGGAAGSIVYQSGAGTTTTLALGTTNYVLTAGASAPTYVAQSALSVGAATNATNATNLALTAGSGATNYIIYAAATTGNQPQYTSTGLTFNATNSAITSGISGGGF